MASAAIMAEASFESALTVPSTLDDASSSPAGHIFFAMASSSLHALALAWAAAAVSAALALFRAQ